NLARGRPLAEWGALSPRLQRARSPAVHTPESVQLPGLPVSVQRHLGDFSPRDASSAKDLAAGHVSHGHFHSWRQCPSVVSVARNWLPKRLAPDASGPLSGRNRLSLESAQSRGPGGGYGTCWRAWLRALSRSRSACDEEGSEERDLPVGPLPARHEPGQGGTGSGSSPGLERGRGSREQVSVAPLLRDRKLRDFGSCPLRSSGHGLPAPDDPRSGSGAVGGLDPESPEGFHPTGSSIEPRRGSTPPAAHREPLESLVLEGPGPDERRHTGAGRGQSACPQDH